MILTQIETGKNRTVLSLKVYLLGKDYLLILEGANPHLGGLSLTWNQDPPSHYSRPHHKDIELTKIISEMFFQATNEVILCIGGVHLDNISKKEIQEFIDNAHLLAKKLCDWYEGTKK